MEAQLKNIIDRLQRTEARLVRGFNELGVQVVDTADWFRVDTQKRIVYLKSAGKSISAIWIAMREHGCAVGVEHVLHVNGEVVGSIELPRSKG